MTKTVRGYIEVERNKPTATGPRHVIMMHVPWGSLDSSYITFFYNFHPKLRLVKDSDFTIGDHTKSREDLVTVTVPAKIGEAEFTALLQAFSSSATDSGLLQERQVPKVNLTLVK